MSLDQFVACRKRPALPDQLPEPARWERDEVEGTPFFSVKAKGWLVSVCVEPDFPEDLRGQLAEELADIGAGGSPDDYGVLVSVVVEPVSAGEDAIALQMAVLDVLIDACDGVVLAN